MSTVISASFGIILILGGPGYATIEVEICKQAVQLFNLPMAVALAAEIYNKPIYFDLLLEPCPPAAGEPVMLTLSPDNMKWLHAPEKNL